MFSNHWNGKNQFLHRCNSRSVETNILPGDSFSSAPFSQLLRLWEQVAFTLSTIVYPNTNWNHTNSHITMHILDPWKIVHNCFFILLISRTDKQIYQHGYTYLPPIGIIQIPWNIVHEWFLFLVASRHSIDTHAFMIDTIQSNYLIPTIISSCCSSAMSMCS